jgi:TRAP-type C4-dicarboxylate transport system permease small subunit
VLDRFLPGRLKSAKDVLIHSFTSGICGVVTWHSYQFVLTSHEYGDMLMGGVPAWIPQAVLPLGFALICYRYALFVLGDLSRLWRGTPPE